MPVCSHDFLYLDKIETDQVQATCLTCESTLEMDQDTFQKLWIAFESTEAPGWSPHLRHQDRDVVLVRRRMIR